MLHLHAVRLLPQSHESKLRRHDVQVDLLGHISDAWLWTVASKSGLFSAAAAPVAVNPSADEPEGGREPASAAPAGVAAHHAWLLFLLEVWQVQSLREHMDT